MTGHGSSETVRALNLQNTALKMELKSSMDKHLDGLVALEAELRSGGGVGTSATVGGSRGGGGGAGSSRGCIRRSPRDGGA